MTIKFFTSSENISVDNAHQHFKNENNFRIKSLKISHNVNQFANANIEIFYKNVDKIMSCNYCIALYNDEIIFIGKIKNISFKKSYAILISHSNPDEELKRNATKYKISRIFNPNNKSSNEMLVFDSKMNVFNLNHYNKTIFEQNLKNENIYKKEIYSEKKKKSTLKLKIKWLENTTIYQDIITTLLKKHSELSEIDCIEMNKNFPKNKRKFGKYTVISSQPNKETNKTGKLILKSKEKHNNVETWMFNLHLPNIKNLNINLDGTKHISQYPTWEINKFYSVQDIVIKNDKIVECTKNHMSTNTSNENMWVNHEDNFISNINSNVNLFSSTTGQMIFKNFLDILYCYTEKNNYDYIINVTAPWKQWSNIEVMNLISFNDHNNEKQYGRLISYEKVFNKNSKYIKFKIYFSKYKQPIISRENYTEEVYFANEYIDKNNVENYNQFLFKKSTSASNLNKYRNYIVDPLRQNNKLYGFQITDKNYIKNNDNTLNFELYRKEE